MTSRDFCYWLQGYLEISGKGRGSILDEGIDPEATTMIRKHLDLVFKHEIDPSFGDKEMQDALNKIHSDNNPIVRC